MGGECSRVAEDGISAVADSDSLCVCIGLTLGVSALSNRNDTAARQRRRFHSSCDYRYNVSFRLCTCRLQGRIQDLRRGGSM